MGVFNKTTIPLALVVVQVIICQFFLVNLYNIDAIRYCDSGLWRYFLSAGVEKGIKYSQDQSSIMLLFEHYFRHNMLLF